MRKHWLDALALVLLASLVLGFFWPLLSGRYVIPRGGGDLVSFLWPTWRFAARSLRQGVLPLWNPTLYAGMPFAADNQSSLFYPINLLCFLLLGEPGYTTMEALVVLHMILAAALMFLLLRDKGLSRAAAVLGGLAFGLSDLFVTHIGNLNLSATIAYLPAVVMLADRAFTRSSPGWAAAAGAVLAVGALAGHGQMLLFLGLSLGLLGLYRAACASRAGAGAVARILGLAAMTALVGIAGAAVALYPAYELTGHSMRAGGLSYEEATRFSLPWRALVGLVAPRFYGRGAHAFWGAWDRVEVGYLGVLPLALALAALAPRGKGEPAIRFPVPFFAMLALASLALALGGNTPLYRVVHRLPLFSGLRAPARLTGLLSFALAALAAQALDRLRGSRRVQLAALLALGLGLVFSLSLTRAVHVLPERLVAGQRATWLSASLCMAGLLWVGVATRRPRARWLGAAAVGLVALDLIVSGSTVEIDRGDPWRGYQHGEVVAWLQSDPSLFRIDSSAAQAWQPDAAAVHGLYDIAGVANPLGLARYEMYRWSIGGRGDTLYSLLGVKYVLADKGSPPGDERLVPVYTAAPEVDIYLNTTAYPLAQLVYEAIEVRDGREALQAIHAGDFDPARTVVLEEEPLPVEGPGDQPSSLGFAEYGANRLALEVDTPTSAYLLLSEVYHPGWRASIDGRPARVLPADYLFRAIHIPPGAHQVRLWFSPTSLWTGLGLSLATWLGLITWGVTSLVRSRGGRRLATADTQH